MSVEKSLSAFGNASKSVAIGLGILILTSFVAVYGMNMFLDQPEYEDYCPTDLYKIETETACIDAGGEWQRVEVVSGEEPVKPGYCSEPRACYEEYDKDREGYAKILFIVSIPLGLLIIALGTFVFSLSSVGVGIMLGGVYTLIYGAANYWRYGEDWMRFLVSLIGLVALVLIAYRFARPKKKK
jgi:hypothetical protein